MRSVCLKVVTALLCLFVLSATCSGARWFKRARMQKSDIVKQSVMVFPFDAASELQIAPQVAKALADAARDRLQKTGKYNVVVFSERLAPIQRAVEVDQVIKVDQTKPPYGDDSEKILTLARLVSVDLVLTGMVESYTVDAAGKSVSVVLSAQLIDVKTGRSTSGFTATGKSSDAVQGIDPNDLRATALADAISKLGLDKKEEGAAAADTSSN